MRENSNFSKITKNVINSWKLDREYFDAYKLLLKYKCQFSNFCALCTLEFFSKRTADAKKSIFVLLFGKCIYLQLLKKLALYDNSLSRKKHFSDARGQNDPPLGSTRVNVLKQIGWSIKKHTLSQKKHRRYWVRFDSSD